MNLFSPIGQIKDLNLNEGFAFIEYDSIRSAEEAVSKLNNLTLHRNRISVEYSKPKNSGGDRGKNDSRDDRGRRDDKSRKRSFDKKDTLKLKKNQPKFFFLTLFIVENRGIEGVAETETEVPEGRTKKIKKRNLDPDLEIKNIINKKCTEECHKCTA